MSELPDDTDELQALLEKGEAAGYDELLAHASRRLQRLTRRMLRDFPRLSRWEQTDDVFQTAALKLHESLTVVRPQSVRQFFGLAATQIRRTLIDLARHHYGPEGHATKHASGVQNDRSSTTEAPESLAAWAEFHEQVGRLPDDEREVFHLVWYSGTTQREAAKILDVSERTVLRRYHRAILSLRSFLRESDGEGVRFK